MSSSELQFQPIDFERDKDLCLSFRKDAHQVSFGHLDNYNPASILQWYQKLLRIYPQGFVHVLLDGQIIGQLEFNTVITTPDGAPGGYIYFIYLLPEYRGCGFGQQLIDYSLEQMASAGCQQIALRYIEGNYRAEQLYLKNGWQKQGLAKDKSQLLVKHV